MRKRREKGKERERRRYGTEKGKKRNTVQLERSTGPKNNNRLFDYNTQKLKPSSVNRKCTTQLVPIINECQIPEYHSTE